MRGPTAHGHFFPMSPQPSRTVSPRAGVDSGANLNEDELQLLLQAVEWPASEEGREEAAEEAGDEGKQEASGLQTAD